MYQAPIDLVLQTTEISEMRMYVFLTARQREVGWRHAVNFHALRQDLARLRTLYIYIYAKDTPSAHGAMLP